MSYLLYINGLGPNYKGENIYEFIFGDSLEDVWGENWEARPANGYPSPPDVDHVKKVGTLTHNEITLELVQNSEVGKKKMKLIFHWLKDWFSNMGTKNRM